MSSCKNIYNQYKRRSQITSNGYIDPEGYEYDTRSVVVCEDCMFHIYQDSCLLYKEEGVDESNMGEINRNVWNSNFCDYFLMKTFSEGDSEDEEVREKVMDIAKGYNYPSEYWSRINSSTSHSSSSKSGGCFVTTAICEILNKGDHCYELETLRKFRDNVLLQDDNLKNIVFEYYRLSPTIVNILENIDSKKEFSRDLLNDYINKMIFEIQNNKTYEAIECYELMLKKIMEKK